jgi:hypothetical protein
MEDRQPNEVRLDRKGKSAVPAITVARRGGYRGSFRGFDSSRGRPPYHRPSNQRNFVPHSTTSPAWNNSKKFSSVSSLNPPRRSSDHVRQEPFGHVEQSNLHPPKRTKLNSQQFSPGESQGSERHFQRRGLPHTNITSPSQCPKVNPGAYEMQAVLSPYKIMNSDRSVPGKMSEGECKNILNDSY